MRWRALVFDFDGLVVETEEPELIAWQEVFAEHGAPLTLDDWADAIGTVGGVDVLGLLTARVGQRAAATIDPTEVWAGWRRRHRELVDATVLQPGVLDALDAADSLGLPVGIASSSPPAWIERHLERLGLRQRFATIASFDDVGVAKPDPAVYRCAIERLGVEPEVAVAFEDSRHGLLAAKGAGLTCVVVPTVMTRALDFAEADLVMGSMDEQPLPELLETLERVVRG